MQIQFAGCKKFTDWAERDSRQLESLWLRFTASMKKQWFYVL